MFQFADNWKKHIIATRLGSMERAITVFTIEKQISFSVLILIVLLEKKKRNLSAILERVPRTIIYNTLHKEIPAFYDYVSKKCVQH